MKPLLPLMLLMSIPAVGQWARYVTSGKEPWSEVAEAHPLSYFTHEAVLRNDNGQVGCSYCTEVENAKVRAEGRAEVSKVGKIGKYNVYDVYYYFDRSKPIAGAESILLETAPDGFREIFYIANLGWFQNPDPTQIIGVRPPNQILSTAVGVGNMGLIDDHQLWVASGAALHMNMEDVRAAQERLLISAHSENARREAHTYPLEFRSKGMELIAHSAVHDESGNERGSIDITFKIDHGRAIVTGTSYTARRP
jgi:hypothetical protein